jgi:lipopolysaccharide export system permease protein
MIFAPSILSRYIAWRLFNAIVITFIIIFSLVFLIDFVNLLQDLGQSSSARTIDVMLLTLQRTPLIAEEIFPFTILFAAIAAFVSLSRKMELVVARATGISIWQMLAPALLTAGFVGIAATAAYNPAATWLKERSIQNEIALYAKSPSKSSSRWIRQQSAEDQSIIRAKRSGNRGQKLAGVTAFVFTLQEGAFVERIEAATANLKPGYWEMRSARVMRAGMAPESHPVYRLATHLTAEQVAETITSPETISFWELSKVIEQWDASGINTRKFQLQYQELLARPALFATMVLIAVMVSLGLARLGGVSRAILGGVLAGFVLYIAGEMASDLGAAGFITPFVAAWAPPIIGVLMSVTVLLYREDG